MNDAVALTLLQVVGGIFAAAALFIAVAWRGRYRESRVWTKFGTEFGILAAVLVPSYFGGWVWLAAALVLGGLSARELYAAIARIGPPAYTGAGLVSGGVVIFAAAGRSEGLDVALVAAVAVAVVSRGIGWQRVAHTAYGLLYPVAGAACLVAMVRLDGGYGYLVFCYALTEINDVVAWLVGAAVGRHRIFPTLSPNKTLEGSAAGALATVGFAFAMSFSVPGFSGGELLASGLLIALGGPIGDLLASGIKRRAGTKDFSDWIPTQGGVLDLYDALFFVAPFFYYYLRAGGH